MAKSRSQEGVQLNPKEGKSGQMDSVTTPSVVPISSPYAPGSLTFFLQSSSAAAVVNSSEPSLTRKGKWEGRGEASTKVGKKKTEHLRAEDEGLNRLRALFERVHQPQLKAEHQVSCRSSGAVKDVAPAHGDGSTSRNAGALGNYTGL